MNLDNDDFTHFTCLVIGDNPEEQIKKYLGTEFSTYNKKNLFSQPFKLKDGTEAYSAKKCDIDWPEIHGKDIPAYERLWDLVMEDMEPLDEHETEVKEVMRKLIHYFEKFENKETYVAANTSFWTYAVISDETGWVDITAIDSYFWITMVYDVYISHCPDDTLLTIFECNK